MWILVVPVAPKLLTAELILCVADITLLKAVNAMHPLLREKNFFFIIWILNML
jgi:hypothetical protein